MQITKQYDTDLVERAQLNIFCQDIILSMWVGHKSTFSEFLSATNFSSSVMENSFLIMNKLSTCAALPWPGSQSIGPVPRSMGQVPEKPILWARS